MTNTTSASDEVIISDLDGIRTITINRPDTRNAVNLAVATRIHEAIDELDEDRALTVGILTGAGGYFCAGMDLRAFLQGERPITSRGFAGLTEQPSRKPLIAAVEGFAHAGGFELMLACDMVVASKEARFSLPEVKRGLIAAAGGLLRLPQRVPLAIAMELALTGKAITADTAYQFGLVNALTEPGHALPRAIELAQTIASNGPLAVAATKQVLTESRLWSDEDRFSRQRQISDPVRDSEDASEGARAFLEKRAPVWRGE